MKTAPKKQALSSSSAAISSWSPSSSTLCPRRRPLPSGRALWREARAPETRASSTKKGSTEAALQVPEEEALEAAATFPCSTPGWLPSTRRGPRRRREEERGREFPTRWRFSSDLSLVLFFCLLFFCPPCSPPLPLPHSRPHITFTSDAYTNPALVPYPTHPTFLEER